MASPDSVPRDPLSPTPGEDARDLGIGGRIAQNSYGRMLNHDGTFNVVRRGMPFWHSINIYHALLMLSWMRFFTLVIAFYIFVNVFFAGAFYMCGPDALQTANAAVSNGRFLDALFFSVQTLSTIGYGSLMPHGIAANVVVTFEALTGILFFAIATGLIFSRFSRPVGKILFSRQALISPYRGMTAFEFRVINELSNQLIHVEARVVFSRLVMRNGHRARAFEELTLERASVTVFPLQWTIVHPINDQSPLFGMTALDMEKFDVEFMILLSGFDETFSQMVHTRGSYKFHEMVHGARFTDMLVDSEDGRAAVDMRKFHEIEPTPPQNP